MTYSSFGLFELQGSRGVLLSALPNTPSLPAHDNVDSARLSLACPFILKINGQANDSRALDKWTSQR